MRFIFIEQFFILLITSKNMPKTKEFLKLEKAVKKQYLGKSVPRKYQARYGKFYDKEEVEGISFAIAKSKGIRIDKSYSRRKK